MWHRAGRTWVRGNEIGRVESTLTSASSPRSTNTTLQPPVSRHGHGTCTHPSTHGASVGFLGLEGSCHRPRDRRGASRSQRQPAATLDARCEHPRQRGQLNPTQEPSAAARGRVAEACRTCSNRGAFRRDLTSDGSRRRNRGASAPCSSATPWRRGSPPTWRGSGGQAITARGGPASAVSRARTGSRGAPGASRRSMGSWRPTRGERQPPDPAADTCEHGGRCQSNPLLEPGDGARERVRHGQSS